MIAHVPSPLSTSRRLTREVDVGGVGIGGSNPIRNPIDADQRHPGIRKPVFAKPSSWMRPIVRLLGWTAQTRKIAANLENIVGGIRAKNSNVPRGSRIFIFKPDAAMEAANWVEKSSGQPQGIMRTKRNSGSANTPMPNTPMSWTGSRKNSVPLVRKMHRWRWSQ